MGGTVTPDDFAVADLRKLADHLLEVARVECVDDGVLLVMSPPAGKHRIVVRLLVEALRRAYMRGEASMEWAIDSENS
jgi:Uma2 family endonuclease